MSETPTSFRPTRAEIDLEAIRDNVVALGAHLGPGVERLAVVKANGYGHGATQVARAALEAGATWLGVAMVEEGIALREAGIDAPILLLIEPPIEAAKAIVVHGLTASVYTRASAEALDQAAQAAGTQIDVHLCVDTGMHREGVSPEDVVAVASFIDGLTGVRVQALWSHFAVADESDDTFTRAQIDAFRRASEDVAAAGIDVPLRHLGNSAGQISYPDAHLNLVRMGIAMYGLYPASPQRNVVTLRPALRLVSEVSLVRRVSAGEGVSYGLTYRPSTDATIVNIPIGYGDGFSRNLSNKAEVLIGGKRRTVAGRVTMDTIMADCGDDDIEPGAEVVLIGRQDDEEITADELAVASGTINYEVVCAIGPRVPRVYLP
jgi:alanine racemase